MCGIFFSLYAEPSGTDAEGWKEPFDSICDRLRQLNTGARSRSLIYKAEKGPDYQSSVVTGLSNEDPQNPKPIFNAEFFGAELHLRGDDAVQQPHRKDGNILCWNGEIFGGIEVSAQENDGVRLVEELSRAKDSDGVVEVLGRLEGPIYFSRDPLGRRSLLIHIPALDFPVLFISSVSAGLDSNISFDEVSTESIHYVDLETLEQECLTAPWDATLAEAIGRSISQLPRFTTGFESPIFLDESTYLQVRDIPRSGPEKSARVSVLFSGGIDSTVVAYLAHRHTPLAEPIDLLNVGFENPRKLRVQQVGNGGATPTRQKKRERAALENANALPTEPSYRVPDRVTGLQELEELRKLCPGRAWNFVEVNVPYDECQSLKQKVEDLMLPSRTVMDLSLALALYFAARGKGQIRSSPGANPVPYTSPARVVLSGLGSDELLGGYGRHKSAYNAGGWPAVIEELQLEIDRIPTRNLGRDDRIISSHGKETRHPFLSLDVVNFLARLPVHHKLDPRLDVGAGDKTLLRLVVRKLGLVEASCRKKRAMQFGSHSARMDGEKKGDAPLDDQ
ncbi:hypothetical protein FA13DRAFT_1725127 [Coprinellus micaceus]|uniref:Asparagine synthetase domain-containing protein n=1 Tax=Coprinellus micaceus TaxID=71717 RepID=A0A4Y7TYV0_COPMI|nr:hypothetical protein FA13DRAFT_1725127 [Coprinellus micaceus]